MIEHTFSSDRRLRNARVGAAVEVIRRLGHVVDKKIIQSAFHPIIKSLMVCYIARAQQKRRPVAQLFLGIVGRRAAQRALLSPGLTVRCAVSDMDEARSRSGDMQQTMSAWRFEDDEEPADKPFDSKDIFFGYAITRTSSFKYNRLKK